MAESNDTPHDTAQKTWKRRGLFAAAAALVAGLIARVNEQRVEAGTDGDVVLGILNTTPQRLTWVESTYPGDPALHFFGMGLVGTCDARGGTGLFGRGSYVGVHGSTFSAVGELGIAGVRGVADGTTSGTAGVWGFGGVYGAGVRGSSESGIAMLGEVSSASNANTTAIYGVNSSGYTGSVPGTGGFGVVGVSLNGHGVVGATSAAGAGAVVGATDGIAGAYAGIFFGPAIVEGDFTVTGAKSAAVPHPDGSHRRLYCVESPESWFEDFGESELACGEATVAIDPDFAAVTHLDDYHVFLTAYGDFELHVSDRASTGFRVRAKDATASGRFSWRVVAKRKDIASPRFESVTVPPKPVMPAIPDPPAMPTPPLTRRHH